MQANTIYNENNVATVKRMADGMLDLTVTSYPYDDLRTYDGYEFDWKALGHELFRATKKGGVFCLNINNSVKNGGETLTVEKIKIYYAEEVGWRVHDTMIYQKLNFSQPEKTRYHQVFEYVIIFSKGAPATFNPIKDRKNKTAGEWGNKGINTFANADGTRSERKKNLTADYGMRHNVWLGKTRGQEEMCKKLPYTAMMPKWLAKDLIISFSNEGDIVYDPCGGSGTTIVEAAKLNRKWIMSDVSENACRIANEQF